MRVGVVSEGWADFAVLRNALKAVLDLDASEVQSIRPELQTDETSAGAPDARTFSNWGIVRQECEQWAAIEAFLDDTFDETLLVVVHVDTAECHLPGFDVIRPDRTAPDYVTACHDAVLAMLHLWTGGRRPAHLVGAVAVEETDAWLLAHYAPIRDIDTGALANPKERLQRALERTNAFSDRERESIRRERSMLTRYHRLSEPLRKPRNLRAAMAFNASLARFVARLCDAAEALAPGACRVRALDP